MPFNLEDSTANFKAALSGHHEHLIADAYDFVKTNKTEIAVVAVLVGASAVAFATRGKVVNPLFKGAEVDVLAGSKILANPQKYSSIAAEVAAYSRPLVNSGKNPASFYRHDSLAHVLTLKNPATVGGELRGAISESVAEQMLKSRGRSPHYAIAEVNYFRSREALQQMGYNPPEIPEPTLQKWFYLSEQKMRQNLELWGHCPKIRPLEKFMKLNVEKKWAT